MSELSLDEAIKHCLEVVEKNEQAKKDGNLWIDTEYEDCCTNHRQLAEWLQELRAYRKLRICSNCRHYVGGTTHFGHFGECHVTSDIEPCVVCVNQTACDTFFDNKDFRNGV